MISAQFHCDTSLQCACCVVKLLYYARIISPEYHYRIIFLFSLKAEGRRFDGFVNAGGTVGVSTTNCGVTADGVVYRLDDPWFQCSFNMIFTLDFTVICTSLKCIWYFSLNTCFTMLGWVIYRIIIVSFSFLLKIEDRRLDGFVVADGTAGCHNDSLRCHWWWQASRSFLRVAQNRVFKCFIYVLNPK